MSETDFHRDGISPVTKVGLLVGVAAVVSAILAVLLDPQLIGGVGRGMGQRTHAFDLVTELRLFLSTFNILLLVVLAWSYLTVFRDLPNQFTFSLVLFTLALLLYAVASNPAVHLLFGYRGGPGLGPFAFLPDLFAAIAVTVLLYQNFQ